MQATVLIETLPAAFEMDEILWELREHSAGLNCGRWDYIFSLIKTLREDSNALMPDRSGFTRCLNDQACIYKQQMFWQRRCPACAPSRPCARIPTLSSPTGRCPQS